ncbi:ABC transporter permease [Oscillibacter sp. MSJ-2]|uniref:ABC transporter permease n=1 Tax=Dysosmobacter acutus TaxID=2841504 RepID=A0ABS6F799_9FIRM|nr:ABC transporter permease [Dysosmobacter acutus]MBU5626146.1 ABC transporter permease [Dysosmobacter acutus]
MELAGLLLASALRSSIPVALSAIGGTFSARSGTMPMGMEGFILMGAFGATCGSYYSGSALVGLICGVLIAWLYAMIHGVLCVQYHMNQVICGIGLNMFAAGFTASLTQIIWGSRAYSDSVSALPHVRLPILGTTSLLLPATMLIGIVGWVFLFRTTWGLRLRIVGEKPLAARSIGISIKKYRFLGESITGILCGLAGCYLAIDHVNRFTFGMSAGRGYIAVAVNILGKYNPVGSMLGSLIFGFSASLKNVFTDGTIPSQLLEMCPYLVTILVVTFAVRHVRAPAGIADSGEE